MTTSPVHGRHPITTRPPATPIPPARRLVGRTTGWDQGCRRGRPDPRWLTESSLSAVGQCTAIAHCAGVPRPTRGLARRIKPHACAPPAQDYRCGRFKTPHWDQHLGQRQPKGQPHTDRSACRPETTTQPPRKRLGCAGMGGGATRPSIHCRDSAPARRELGNVLMWEQPCTDVLSCHPLHLSFNVSRETHTGRSNSKPESRDVSRGT